MTRRTEQSEMQIILSAIRLGQRRQRYIVVWFTFPPGITVWLPLSLS